MGVGVVVGVGRSGGRLFCVVFKAGKFQGLLMGGGAGLNVDLVVGGAGSAAA